jgi:hydrogenase/urease accessory protein HupE
MVVLLSAVLAIGLGFTKTAKAHFSSVGYSDISVEGKSVRFDLYLPADLMEQMIVLDKNRNGQLEEDEASASKAMLHEFAKDFLKVTGGEAQGKPAVTEVIFTERGSHRMLNISLEYLFNNPITDFGIEYHVFFDGFDPGHQNMAVITSGGQTREIVFDQKNRFIKGVAGSKQEASGKVPVLVPSWVLTCWTYTNMGIEHILSGYDHLLFLSGLLLAGGKMKEYLQLLTAFTVGHSLTLALSVLEILTVPIFIVEPLIALSIVYIAIENIWKPNVRWRWLVALLFGFVHGFGFADLLRGKLETNFALPLFSFNLGVELGQVFVVLLILPLLLLLRKTHLQFHVIRSFSGLIALCGMYWFVERILWNSAFEKL